MLSGKMAGDTAVQDMSAIDRLLRVFGDVRSGEGRTTLLLFANIFLLLVAYYVLKTIREPLVLATGGAELKTYAAAAQAALLLFYVPAYGSLTQRLPPRRLVIVVLLFFLVCIQLFFFGGLARVPYLGFAFYVWVGIFSLTCIAQFWSFANDTYAKEEGDRLFPLIAIGATAGAPLGAALAEQLFARGMSTWTMMQVASVLLVAHLLLYPLVRKRRNRGGAGTAVAGRQNGFALVLQSRYLRLVALLLVLLNVVNTTGEYILASLVTSHASQLAATNPGLNQEAFIGQFYGNYFFWVNIASVALQALLVSRVVKLTGLSGVLLALPVVAFGAYGLIATGASLALVRWVKTAENSADYSFMNTAKQMLWLVTTREQKYNAKQAIDTFFVRFGDMMAAGVVFVGTEIMTLSTTSFAVGNLIFLGLGLTVALLVLRENRRLSAELSGAPVAEVDAGLVATALGARQGSAAPSR
jgi:AAA family ATP:ADP antiporter